MILTSPVVLKHATTPLSFHQIDKDLPFLLTSLIYCYLCILFFKSTIDRYCHQSKPNIPYENNRIQIKIQ